MELEESISGDDEKNDLEVIRRVLDEMVESRLEVVRQDEPGCISNSECWKETGIKLLSHSECRIFDGETSELKEGPPKKRKKGASDASSDWNEERAKIRAVAVDANFVQRFS